MWPGGGRAAQLVIDTPATAELRFEAPSTEPRLTRSAWRDWLIAAQVATDVIAATIACLLSYLVRGPVHSLQVLGLNLPADLLIAIALPAWLAGHLLSGSYRPSYATEGLKDFRAPIVVGLRTTAAVAIASFAFKADLSRVLVVVYFPTVVVISLLGRFVVRRVLSAARKRGLAQVRLMLVGDVASVRRFAAHLRRKRSLGYEIAGVCVPGSASKFVLRDGIVPVFGDPDEVVAAAGRENIEAVAIANPSLFEDLSVQRLSWALERSGIDLMVAPDVAEVAGPRIRIAPITGLPLLHITEPRVDGLVRRLVSLMSQIAAVPLILLLSPLFAIAAVAIKLHDGGPIFYRQERVGYRGRRFHITKFRTMVPDADRRLSEIIHLNEHDGALFKVKDDPRVTPVGRWLRKYSIDELPQLFNVLRGEMVFVGPRPVLAREMGQFGEAEQRRFLAKPGITGLWQVSGRSTIPWEDAVNLDLYYVENWSPILDLLIMCRTLWVVLAGTGM